MAMTQVVMQLHIPESGKAVEPCVGHGFHCWSKAVLTNTLDQLVALTTDICRPGLSADEGHVALCLGGGHFKRAGLLRQPQKVRARGNSRNEVFACLRGVGLEVCFVHFSLLDTGNLTGTHCRH